MGIVCVKLDARAGKLEIEADSEVFDSVATRATELLKSLEAVQLQSEGIRASSLVDDTTAEDPAFQSAEETSAPKEPKKPRKKGGAKQKNVKIIDDLLSEAQRDQLRVFFSEKSPKTQPEIVAVLCHKLKELTGRDRFSQDEVHTCIQTVNLKTPVNLGAVFNNMTTRHGFGAQIDGMFAPNFKCDDFVKHDLPKKQKSDG